MTKTSKSYEETLHNASRYPLAWPANWPRVNEDDRKEARFGKRAGRRISITEGSNRLLDETYRIKAQHVVISTNVPVKRGGDLYANEPQNIDTGVAVYFTLNAIPCCFACDKWDRVGDNLTAIACHIKTMRDQVRWGVGSMEQAFRGYTALPEFSWWDALGVPKNASRQEAQTAYRTKARQAHPDKDGGDHHEMADLNRAWESAQKFYDAQGL